MGQRESIPQPYSIDQQTRDMVLKKYGGTVSIESICNKILSGDIKQVVVMMGAGASVSAGIPDFRSPQTGLYSNLSKYNLPDPEAIFTLEYFLQNPKPFNNLAKELFPGSYNPTITHYFLRLLHQKNILKRIYTQNIDNLDILAGIPEELIVEAHGSFTEVTCTKCKSQVPLGWYKNQIEKCIDPVCKNMFNEMERCNGFVKPDIVFFGEQLPERFFRLHQNDFANADLLIVIGTSLQVQPFANLINAVNILCPRLLLNNELVAYINPKYKINKNRRKINEYLFNNTLNDEEYESSEDEKEEKEDIAQQLKESGHSFTPMNSSSQESGSYSSDNDSEFHNEEHFECNKQHASFGNSGFRVLVNDNYRDVFMKGNCDDSVVYMTKLLGWEHELYALRFENCSNWKLLTKRQKPKLSDIHAEAYYNEMTVSEIDDYQCE